MKFLKKSEFVYRDIEPFDWYQRYGGIKDIITQYLQPGFQILNIGCGNSLLAEEMYEDGYHNITSIDFSKIVIEQMNAMYKEKIPNLKFEEQDIRKMPYHDCCFDAVIDKGTLDSILCGDSSGPNAEKALKEIYRVLNPKGVYIVVTYGLPEQRLEYFKRPEFKWTPILHKVAKTTISTQAVVAAEDKNEKNFHYIYILKKNDE